MLDNFYDGNGRVCSNDKTEQLVHIFTVCFYYDWSGMCASKFNRQEEWMEMDGTTEMIANG